jgi:hypothetical protein
MLSKDAAGARHGGTGMAYDAGDRGAAPAGMDVETLDVAGA